MPLGSTENMPLKQRGWDFHSNEGVTAAREAFERVLVRLQIVASETGIQFDREERLGQIYRDGFSVSAYWSYSYINSLDDSALYLIEWKGRPNIAGHHYINHSLAEIAKHELQFDVDQERTPLWREGRRNSRTFTVDGLAD